MWRRPLTCGRRAAAPKSVREIHRHAADRIEFESHGVFIGLDEKGRDDGAGDNDVAGIEARAESPEEIGNVAHDVDQLAGQRLGIACVRGLCAAAKDTGRKASRAAAGARSIAPPQHDMALENVALENRFGLIGREIEIGQF